ncbi:MAG: alanine/glycine:cation symporter family protein [Huintestinicola sp.]
MNIISEINRIIWGNASAALIFLCGIYITVKTGFIQLRFFGKLRGKSSRRSCLRAVTAALAASLGTGNITGCAAAIAVGGPGAVFWMWASAFTGMAVSYAENYLGVLFRRRYPKEHSFGPMLYMEKSGKKAGSVIALIYAFGCCTVSFFMGNMTQSGAFADAASSNRKSRLFIAVILTILTAAVLFSGKKGSAAVMSVTERAVPVMGIFYLGGAVVLLIITHADVIAAFRLIMTSAFDIRAAAGGLLGQTISTGLRRGVFSNEAGMGSSVIVHSHAGFGSAEQSGAWGCFEVFLDTIVCCTLTALVMICGGYSESCDSFAAVRSAFSAGFGSFGGIFVTISVCLFAYAAVLGWSCCGEGCAEYIARRLRLNERTVSVIYRLCYCAAVFGGAMISVSTSMELADLFNCFVMIPNLFTVLLYFAVKKRDFFANNQKN